MLSANVVRMYHRPNGIHLKVSFKNPFHFSCHSSASVNICSFVFGSANLSVPCSFKFRSSREVARDNSFLMKVTHLHWQISEKFSYPSAINYYALREPAFKHLVRIGIHRLSPSEFHSIHVTAVVSISHDKITT